MTPTQNLIATQAQRLIPLVSELYERALAIWGPTLDARHPKIVTCRENYEVLLRA